MESWVILAIGVAVAAAVSARPLSRLRNPKKNDKLKICLSVAIVVAAAVVGWSRPHKTSRGGGIKYLRPLSVYRGSGGAQCTLKGSQSGAGYRPYVVPEDLTVGGGDVAAPKIPTFEPPLSLAVKPVETIAIAPDAAASDVVVGGTLRLVGDF
jgi:hypothetical protein